MQWHLLCGSLLVSMLLALGVIKSVRMFGIQQEQLNLIIPLLPVFYALVFPSLEKAFSKSAGQSVRASLLFPPAAPHPKRWSGKLTAILMGALACVLAHFALEWSLLKVFSAVNEAPFELVGRWKLLYLALELPLITAVGGLYVGMLSRSNALLNGLIAGVIASIFMGVLQYIPLYEALTVLSVRWGSVLGLDSQWSNGLVLGLFLQVFFFAVWSGLGFWLWQRLFSGGPTGLAAARV